MAVKIELKRSSVPGKVPTTNDLELGEIAINTYDGKIYFKKDDGTQAIVQTAGGGSGSVASASYATFAATAGSATSSSYAATASFTTNATSASYAATSSYADNFTVAGTLTAQTIVAQTITSSTEYITGSTIFGSLLSNTHQFTGSVLILLALLLTKLVVQQPIQRHCMFLKHIRLQSM